MRGICFTNVTKFNQNANWRPLQFNVGFENIDVQYSETMGAPGINIFRSVVLKQFKLNGSPVRARERTKIFVYDRSDAPRRQWKNAEDFYELLIAKYGRISDIEFYRSPNLSFQEQTKLFNDATIHIASHGGALANTLFMRPNSGLLEIASFNCENRNNKKTKLGYNQRKIHVVWLDEFAFINYRNLPYARPMCYSAKYIQLAVELVEYHHEADPQILMTLTDHLFMSQKYFRPDLT